MRKNSKFKRKTIREQAIHKGKLGFLLLLKIFFAFFSFFVLVGLLYLFLPWVNLSQVSLSTVLVFAVSIGIATTLYLFLILKVLHILKFR